MTRRRRRSRNTSDRIGKLQYLLYADGNQSLLIVLQALDAGGKDGVIRHVFSATNPQGTWVFGFNRPAKLRPLATSFGAQTLGRSARARS